MAFHNVIPSDRIPELFSVQDRICLITGAGGLGEVTARGFAHNGAKIVLASRTREKAERICAAIREEGGTALALALDVSDLESCRRAAEDTIKAFGRIDILIHTAGIAKVSDSLHPDPALLREILETDFGGTVYINGVVGEVMQKQHWGRIINIGSIDGLSVNCIDGMYYGSSKAALSQATRYLAVSLAGSGVTVNAIAPVWIKTPMMDLRPDDYMKQAAAGIPAGRVSYAEDYLGILYFLAGNASSYVTGQTFLVDGGWSVNRVFSYRKEDEEKS